MAQAISAYRGLWTSDGSSHHHEAALENFDVARVRQGGRRANVARAVGAIEIDPGVRRWNVPCGQAVQNSDRPDPNPSKCATTEFWVDVAPPQAVPKPIGADLNGSKCVTTGFWGDVARLRRCQNRSWRIATVPSARRLDSGATSPRPRRCRNAIGPDRNRSGGRRWNVPSDEALQKHDQARSKSIRCATVVFGSSTRPVLGAQEAAASVEAVGASSDCGTPST